MLKLFTKAECSNEVLSVGCAFLIESSNGMISKKIKLPKETSIFTAEALAIMEALKYIQIFPESQFLVCTDSLSVMEAMKGLHKNRNLTHININIIN